MTFFRLIEYHAKDTHAPEAAAERIDVREVAVRADGTIFVVNVCTINKILHFIAPLQTKGFIVEDINIMTSPREPTANLVWVVRAGH